MEKYNSNKSSKKLNDWLMQRAEKIFKEREKMEQQIQKIIDKTELEIGEREVKVQGNSCYAQVPRKWKGRKVIILLQRRDEEDSQVHN